jgi:guanylate kinase
LTAVKKGKLIIFSAPSGSGKTTLVKYLMEQLNNLRFSVSACTREKRKDETDGKDYYFISPEEFRLKINNNEFVEWEEVYPDHYYGTLFSEVERIRNMGNHVIFDVDVVGGLNIKKQYAEEALAVFVRPPSVSELEKRLLGRATDTSDKIRLRIEKATYELSFEQSFDKVIINDDLTEAKNTALEIVEDFINA